MKRNERFDQIIFAYFAALGGRWPERRLAFDLAGDPRGWHPASAQEARISEHNGCTVRCHSHTNRSRRREVSQPCWFISGVCVLRFQMFNSTGRYAQLQEYPAIEFALRRGILSTST
jgi:hypothetical protein